MLHQRIAAIRPVNREHEQAARAHLDNLTKPRGSLGQLEDVVTNLVCINGSRPLSVRGSRPLSVDPARLFTVAGDHGVVAEGVSPYPQEVTRQMVANFLAGGAAINVLSRTAGAELFVVDAGCAGEPFPRHARLLNCRVAPGTANFVLGPAMSEAQCTHALGIGMDIVAQAAEDGCRCLGVGEMGIGNSTPATALFAAFLHLAPDAITGPGSGLDPHGVRHKAAVVQRALDVHARTLAAGQALPILAALGGYEIAVMAGIILGAAEQGLPVLVDGFIAQSAYVSAIRLCPAAEHYGILTHISAEPGSTALLTALNKKPLLDLGLRLGEGTGCALALPLLRGIVDVYNDMATMDSAGVSDKTAAS